ncbi:MAG: cytochrome c [Anaerolineae bacterium]
MAKKKGKKSSSRQSTKRFGLPTWAFGLICGVILLLVWGAWSVSRSNESLEITVNSQIVSAESLQTGQMVYVQNCASCHGESLEGQPDWKIPNDDGTMKAPPHNEDGHTWHHDDAYLFERIRYGTQTLDAVTQSQSNMPAYDGVLTDEEIKSVLAYLKSTWPPHIQEMQSQR